MAKQGNWNKSYWQKLERMANPIDERLLRNIISSELDIARASLEVNTPVMFGGLKSSIYAVMVDTPDGVSGRLGYTQTPHWDLNPTGPHQDDFTNPELMEMLSFMNLKKPGTKEKINNVINTMEDFRDNCRNRIADAIKHGGK